MGFCHHGSLSLTFSSWLAAFCTFGAGSSFGVYQDFYTLSGTSHHPISAGSVPFSFSLPLPWDFRQASYSTLATSTTLRLLEQCYTCSRTYSPSLSIVRSNIQCNVGYSCCPLSIRRNATKFSSLTGWALGSGQASSSSPRCLFRLTTGRRDGLWQWELCFQASASLQSTA